MLRSLKDKSLAKALKTALNTQLKPYGYIETLQIDSMQKSLSVAMSLKGERETLSIEIGSYGIWEENGQYFIECEGVTTSKEWLSNAAKEYLEGRRFEIPARYGKILKMVV